MSQALAVSRERADRRGADALFDQVRILQRERNQVQKEIGSRLGEHRMHVAAEVWKPGIYAYRAEAGGDTERVRISSGRMGLEALLPGRSAAVPIETLHGYFEGPLAASSS